MTVIVLAMFIVLSCFCKDIGARKNVVSLTGSSQILECAANSEETNTYIWDDVSTEPDTRLFIVDRNGVVKDPTSESVEKYNNFEIVSLFPQSVNLVITPVELNDEGTYACELIRGGLVESYKVQLEVPPSSVSIKCNPSTNCPSPNAEVTSTLACSCRAFGAYPQTLKLRWIGAEPDTTELSIRMASSRSFDFTQNATRSITGPSGSVQCILEGYVNTIDEADRRVIYDYSSPTCVLKVEYDTSCSGSTANLICSCSGSSPEVNTYLFFDAAGSILNGVVQGSVMLNVAIEPDTETKFYCRGCNGVNFGEQSLSEVTICGPAVDITTVITPTDTFTNSSGDGDATTPVTTIREGTPDPSPELTDCNQRSGPALIAVSCFEGVVIVVMMVVFVLLHRVKKGSDKGMPQGLVASPRVILDKKNTEYMDLQETTKLSSSYTNFDVAIENLNLQMKFPGNGLMNYYKAQLYITSKQEQVVVKTVSDDAPVRLAKLHADEAEKLPTLSSNVNIIQIFGRCVKVPCLVCYEYVNGINLAEYLRENFQSGKVHQYGNTKQKRYHVAEKGSVESLPVFALHISRGMKFLRTHKFIHPGLRSEKIIVDVSGQCKLYDFVSEDNANDIIAILWSKSVPYQWMPPEYLFLEKLGPAVDVWSFGVLIWEIFNYGSFPHPGKNRDAVEKELREKEHLPLPNNCPGAIWQIALSCWEHVPDKRPSFENMSVQLSHMCNDNKEYAEIQSK